MSPGQESVDQWLAENYTPPFKRQESAHDPLCPELQFGENADRDWPSECQCALIARVRADEQRGMYARYMVDREAWEAEVREHIAEAIEQAALVWQVYLDSNPTEIERQLAWARVDAMKGCERIARGGGQ